ncbi:hypothetical protein XENOCAPTIV_021496 [Xenoophorus captivus]|uniref:Uncharacterized protein n=2 Tax=Goodeidae TaxID=28758 RepID=A0ABV0R1G8_9TELE
MVLYPGQRVMELQQLSDTRWACREAALKALQRNLNAVLKLLDDIIDSSPPNLARGDAQMYRNANQLPIHSLAGNHHINVQSHCSGIRFSPGRRIGPFHCLQGD